MYNQGYALSIKSGGEFLREKNVNGERQAYLQFDSEYSIFIKNKTNFKSSVKVKLDGKFVHPKENSFVINPNSSLDLERFVIDGDLKSGERFKFVNVHGSGETPGEAENGLVEVIIQQEKKSSILKELRRMYKDRSSNWNVSKKANKLSDKEIYGAFESESGNKDLAVTELLSKYREYPSMSPQIQFSDGTGGLLRNCCDTTSVYSCSVSNSSHTSGGIELDSFKCDFNDDSQEGVTIGGSQSNQRFNVVEDFAVSSEEITLRIRLKPTKISGKSKGICPGCDGRKVQTDKYGMKVICPVCDGSGRF